MTSNRKKLPNPGQPRKNLNQITDLKLKKLLIYDNLNQITDLKSNLWSKNANLGQPKKTPQPNYWPQIKNFQKNCDFSVINSQFWKVYDYTSHD